MNPVVRSVLAVLGGMLAAFVVIALVQVVGMIVYPPPAGLNPQDREAFKAVVANLPRGALLCVLLAYATGSVVGGWVAARFVPRAKLMHAMIVGAFLLGAGIVNLMMIPQPSWFSASAVAIYLLGAWSGGRAAGAGVEAGARPAAG